MPEIFSFYRNGIADKTPYKQYSVEQAIKLIRGGAAADEVARLRAATNKSTRKVLKDALSYFSFSGIFKRCEEVGLIEHSGLICIDFDHVPDMDKARVLLLSLPFVMGLFVSPSGDGYKVIIRINAELHAETFVALVYYFAQHGLAVDTKCIDVSRACFISHDPDAFYNADASPFLLDEATLAQSREALTPAKVNPAITESELEPTIALVEYVVHQIEEQGIDLTDDHDDWIQLAFGLSTLGDAGRDFFHRISAFNSGYSYKYAEYKYNNAARKRHTIQNPAKFFSMAKKAGLDIKMPKPAEAVAVAEQPANEPAPTPKKRTGDYALLNESHGEPLHLVVDEALIWELTEKGYPNILHHIERFNDATASKLRALSNNVRLVSRLPERDFDLCDMMVAKRFTVAINLIADEHKAYHVYLQEHYGKFKGGADESGQLLDLCNHISYFANAIERDSISANVAKHFKKSKGTITKEVNGFIKEREEVVEADEDDDYVLPKWINVDRFYRYGFDWKVSGIDDTGIYFNDKGYPVRLTNFVLTPLIHIYTKEEMGNRRLTELQSGYLKTVIELPTKAFTSMEAFDNIITSEGAFYTLDGFSKSHLNRLKAFYLNEYPKCFELNTLGWQPEGFFSFSNIIYKNQLVEYNNYGYAEVDGQNFLSMGASSALDGVRAEDDIYKNDKYLCYKKAEIDFKRWCELMVGVYPEQGMMGVAFAIMSIFKDVVFKRSNNFPMLYAYGPVGSGKSMFAESVCNLFLHQKSMFNLNQGTDFGFFSELGMYRNVPVGLNEFDENAIKEEWFRALKGAFDGEGRRKGSGLKNKTKTQEIHAAVILIGQYLTTKDDNAVLSRTLPCKFAEKNNRTAAEKALFDELKTQEKQGISSLICDVMAHRDHFAANYTTRFVKTRSALITALERISCLPKSRIVDNYSSALTAIGVMAEKLDLGFAYTDFFNQCVADIVKLAGIMSESNALSTFWKTTEFLLDQNIIESGWHYKVEAESEVKVAAGRDESGKHQTKTLTFEEPKKLLYLRLSTIHALYAKEIRNVTGKVGQNEQTILAYMKDQGYYIGSNPGSWFTDGTGTRKNTSSYVFDYDLLGVNLETFKEEKNDPEVILDGQLWNDAVVTDVIGTPKLKFTLWKDESYDKDGQRINKEVFTNCLSDDTGMAMRLKKTTRVLVTGNLNERKGGARNMAVTKIEINETLTINELPDEEVGF